MARRIPSVGRVAVSERRSITSETLPSLPWISRFSRRTLAERGEPAYRARQVWEWTSRGAASYDAMTTLPKALRATPRRRACRSRLSSS